MIAARRHQFRHANCDQNQWPKAPDLSEVVEPGVVQQKQRAADNQQRPHHRPCRGIWTVARRPAHLPRLPTSLPPGFPLLPPLFPPILIHVHVVYLCEVFASRRMLAAVPARTTRISAKTPSIPANGEPPASLCTMKKVSHTVTLIPGDGIGPEVAEATRKAVDATGVKIDWEVTELSGDIIAKTGQSIPPYVIESIERTKVGLKGPVTTPIGGGYTSVNVGLRKRLDLFANVRPVHSLPGVATRYQDVAIDMVISAKTRKTFTRASKTKS